MASEGSGAVRHLSPRPQAARRVTNARPTTVDDEPNARHTADVDISMRYDTADILSRTSLTSPRRKGTAPMLDLAILGLLEENDLHGYELRKRLGDLLGPAPRHLVRLALPGPRPAREGRPGQGRPSRPGPRRAPRPDERLAGRRARRLPGPAPGRRRGGRPGAAPGQEGLRHHRRRPAAARRAARRPRRVRRPGVPAPGRLLPQPAARRARSPCSSGAAPSWRQRADRAAPRHPGSDGRVNTYLRSLRERDPPPWPPTSPGSTG